MMEKIAVLLTCLAYTSHGRRRQSVFMSPQSSSFKDDQSLHPLAEEHQSKRQVRVAGAFDPLAALAILLAGSLAPAFNPSSPAITTSQGRGLKQRISRRARSPLAGALDEYDVKISKGRDAELKEAAIFSRDIMWGASTTFELEGPMSDRTKEAVFIFEKDDMVARYGELVGSRRFDSKLIEARDKSTGKLVGMVGVEVAVVNPPDGKVFERTDSDSMVKNEILGMSVRERAPFRNMGIVEIMANLFPEYKVFGLLANLCVAPDTRGKGLAKVLCQLCEDQAKKWGMDAIVLQVDGNNTAGKTLYEKLGYGVIHQKEGEVERIQRGAVSRWDVFKMVNTTIVLMGKAL